MILLGKHVPPPYNPHALAKGVICLTICLTANTFITTIGVTTIGITAIGVIALGGIAAISHQATVKYWVIYWGDGFHAG